MIGIFEYTLRKCRVQITSGTALYARYTYIDTIGVVLNLCELSDDPGEGLLQGDGVGQDLMTKG